MDHLPQFAELLTQDDLRSLQGKSNLPAAFRAIVHFAALLLAATAVVSTASGPNWLLVPAIVACGLLIASMHAPLHECVHLTAFRSVWANRLVGWLAGFPALLAPSFYRDFHFAHHRYTHDPQRDPEISAGGERFAYWPVYVHEYLFMASGVLLLVARLVSLLLIALSSRGPWWDKLFPFVRGHNRVNATREARVYVALLSGLVVIGCRLLPGLFYLLFAVGVGFSALVLYLSSEHTGLKTMGTIFERTRTTYTSTVVKFFMWNMPYHTEHHAYPAVPFHALPRLHQRLKPALVNTSPGYFRLQAEVISHLRVLPLSPRQPTSGRVLESVQGKQPEQDYRS